MSISELPRLELTISGVIHERGLSERHDAGVCYFPYHVVLVFHCLHPLLASVCSGVHSIECTTVNKLHMPVKPRYTCWLAVITLVARCSLVAM